MNFLQQITIVSPKGEEFRFDNVYIYDDNRISNQNGIFYPSGKHTAVIETNECNILAGFTANYNGITGTVTAVCDNTKKSKLMPHIRLTLE